MEAAKPVREEEVITMTKISVAMVEDDAGTRDRISRVLRTEPSIELLKEASTANELLAWIEEGNMADVLLVDLGLPDRPGTEVITRCTRLQPSCAVMALTMFADESNMLRAFAAGASGYLLKDDTEEELAKHVRALHGGGSPMSPIIARQLLARWQNDQPPSQPAIAAPGRGDESLTKREMEVLRSISLGFKYDEIAKQLDVSVTTIWTHVRNIYGKLGVHSKTEAVFEARQAGLLR